MSVDKFGRHSAAKAKSVKRGPKGLGFNLTADGDFDIGGKRLKYVNEPEDDADAVNLQSLKDKCLLVDRDRIDCKGKQLCNIALPTQRDDCVTKTYLEQNIVSKTYVDTKIKRIDDLHSETMNAIRLGGEMLQSFSTAFDVLRKNSLTIDGDMVDCKNTRLNNVADPIHSSDVVNKSYVDEGMTKLQNAVGDVKRACNDALAKVVEQHKQSLKRIDYQLYKYMEQYRTGARTNVNENTYVDWNEIFNDTTDDSILGEELVDI